MSYTTFVIKSDLLDKIRRFVFLKKANGEKITMQSWIEQAIQEKIKQEKPEEKDGAGF